MIVYVSTREIYSNLVRISLLSLIAISGIIIGTGRRGETVHRGTFLVQQVGALMARNGSRDRKKARVCAALMHVTFSREGDRRNRDRNGRYARQQSKGFSISVSSYLTMKRMHVELELLVSDIRECLC